MPKRSDIITLISTSAPPEPTPDTDDQGFYLPSPEEKHEVFANKKSVGSSEFYKSSQKGNVAELKFEVRTDEYHGETFIEYKGKRYKKLRTYETKNGEFTDLTVSDLSERDTPEPQEDDSDGEF